MAVSKTALLIAVPVVIVGYVAIAGSTGFCPMCTSIVDTVLGRPSSPAGQPESIAGLKASNLEGQVVSFDSFVGQPVILDFWATWCGPCNAQRSVFADMEGELEGKVQIVAISVDQGGASVVKDHIAQTGHAEANELLDTNGLANAFGVSVIPTLVFVDSTGHVRKVATGTQSPGDLRREIAELK